MGQKINIYWPLDKQSYPATITKITLDAVEVEYDNGMTKAYPLSGIVDAAFSTETSEVSPAIECPPGEISCT